MKEENGVFAAIHVTTRKAPAVAADIEIQIAGPCCRSLALLSGAVELFDRRRGSSERFLPSRARNEWMERKVRHNSRVEKLARMPKIKEGRLLDDVEGCWFLPVD